MFIMMYTYDIYIYVEHCSTSQITQELALDRQQKPVLPNTY